MKALTLTQPWASAVALGIKHVETRSWTTNYRGPLAIHAAKGFPRFAADFLKTEIAIGRLPCPPERALVDPFSDEPGTYPLGAVIAMARLVDVVPTYPFSQTITALERLYGDYTEGRYAWILGDVEALDEAVPAKGALGLWEWRSLLGER